MSHQILQILRNKSLINLQFCWVSLENIANIFLWSGSIAYFLLKKVLYCWDLDIIWKKNHLFRHSKTMWESVSLLWSLNLLMRKYLVLCCYLSCNKIAPHNHKTGQTFLFPLHLCYSTLPPPIPTSIVRNISLLKYSDTWVSFGTFFFCLHSLFK